MTCFKITRGPQDQQLPLAVGLRSTTVQLLDRRGKLWSIANYVICEDGTSSPARPRQQSYEEYLECFRDRVNAFNINTVANDEKVSWLHYVELIWLHGASQTVSRYRPDLRALFSSRDHKNYPAFNAETDSVDATSMFRPRTLKFGEQAFLTAKHPWTVLIAPAEDVNNMNGFCPVAPFQDVPTKLLQFQGIPIHCNVHSNHYSTPIQTNLHTAFPSHSVSVLPRSKHPNSAYPTSEASQHAETASGSTDVGLQKLRRLSQEKKLLDAQALMLIESTRHDGNARLPARPTSRVPEHKNCAVQLRVNQNVTRKEIFDTIRTGAIYSLSIVATHNRMSLFELVFMKRQGAQRYIDMTRHRDGILIRDQRVVAVWSLNRVGPCKKKDVSRVIKLTVPTPDYTLNRFVHYAKKCCWVDIIHRQESVGANREMVLEFGSFAGQAEVVYAKILSDPGFARRSVEFVRDPCDVPEDS
ncbi:hypothetical protein DSL72_006828 [Monilinia vaccinii-corymbosi]|uniref:Uncharacterized protein n=1 Tax=Monilinia vaccinii-corymbosi TaxID=61207 RepID=A0A8A3PLF0_9HELO|nr:hypothetical protein DSL72_006828 [Monilinia vaccinii-corymbosi]